MDTPSVQTPVWTPRPEEVAFSIPGEAIWQRTGGSGRRRFTRPKTRAFENKVRVLASQACSRPFDGPVGVDVVFFFVWPKSKERKRSPRGESPKGNGKDIDNLLKSLFDGCNGVVWNDDSQVAEIRARKRYAAQGEPPQIQVRAWELGGES